ncbi:hypothetical protein [Streptomyces sp. bgisy153]|uniref:hypothetical protein n=1 Tax=Streptomyces sp. bgisy153 TaxID=3413793 RepID=UPI003D71C6F0
MTIRRPGDDATPEGPDGARAGAEDVWLKFLADTEGAIRDSAPRELSARERARRAAGGEDRQPKGPTVDAVGSLWVPEGPRPAPAWRELDGPARARRVVRVLATAAAVALALCAWSWLSTGAGAPAGGPGDPSARHLEEASEEPPQAGPSAALVPPVPAGAERDAASRTTG